MLGTGAAWAQESYVADPRHSQISFETGHLGISWIRGRFNKHEVKAVLDRAAKKGTIEAVIYTDSVDTGLEVRDKLLRSENYFNIEKFPTMTFKSSDLRFEGDTLVSARGELTLLGVTRPVTLTIPMFKCIGPPVTRQETCGVEARAQLKRSDFGVRGGGEGINDQINVLINIEAFKQ
jgi:polyisoprenoid-binding protein YceI